MTVYPSSRPYTDTGSFFTLARTATMLTGSVSALGGDATLVAGSVSWNALAETGSSRVGSTSLSSNAMVVAGSIFTLAWGITSLTGCSHFFVHDPKVVAGYAAQSHLESFMPK